MLPGVLEAVRNPRLVVIASAVILVIAIVVAAGKSGGPAPYRLPSNKLTWSGTPLGYDSSHAPEFVARAVSGSANVLFTKSPGGVVATAARVAAYRPMIDAATKGTGIDPSLLEGLVFLESAGYPDALAGPDAADAAGLTQILAQTGSSLLGMHINLAESRKLTSQIDAAYAAGNSALVAKLQSRRERIDDRFNPRKALAATVRYLKLAEHDLGGREDLAIVSYHMGIGNLQQVLSDYNGGHPVPYVQLYFDTAPNHDGKAYNLLSTLGDDSSLYYWRVLGAVQIMSLYRSDRSALVHLASLEKATGSDADVLHPPLQTPKYRSGSAISSAYSSGALAHLPADPAKYWLAYDARMPALLRGLAPGAVDLLAVLGIGVEQYSGLKVPLIVQRAVTLGGTGWSFEIARRYHGYAQASAFQAMLDRLQALNLIAWSRARKTIDITVASDAGSYLANGP
jgi:hypothetical protein